jgi:hypothetical protein
MTDFSEILSKAVGTMNLPEVLEKTEVFPHEELLQ